MTIAKQLRSGRITLKDALFYGRAIMPALYTVIEGRVWTVKPSPDEAKKDAAIRNAIKNLHAGGYLRMVRVASRKVKFLPTQKLLDEMEKAVAELHNRPARQLLVERLLKRLKALYFGEQGHEGGS